MGNCVSLNFCVRFALFGLSFGNASCLPPPPGYKLHSKIEIGRRSPGLAHSQRKGAARALISAWGTFAQLFCAGQWCGGSVRLFLNLDEGGQQAMKAPEMCLPKSRSSSCLLLGIDGCHSAPATRVERGLGGSFDLRIEVQLAKLFRESLLGAELRSLPLGVCRRHSLRRPLRGLIRSSRGRLARSRIRRFG